MANTIQRELSGSNAVVVTESQLLKSGQGVLRGIVVTATSTGTLKIYDALEGGAAATGTLTSSGACAPAQYASGTLTSDATNVTANDTVTIDTTVYKFVATPAAAYDVKIGTDAATTLDNLKKAVNASGTPGTEYGVGTLVHPTVIAYTNTDTTQVFVAKTIGVSTVATTELSSHLSFGAATLQGGVATTVATVTIGSVTYTAVLSLPETYGLPAIPNYVLWVTSEAVFLDNLKAAINGLGTAGTTYSAGTEPHPQVIATTNSATQQVVVARNIGTSGNSIATTETMGNYAWGAATLASGTGTTGKLLLDTFTPAAGSSTNLYNLEFNNGLYITVGGTSISASVFYK